MSDNTSVSGAIPSSSNNRGSEGICVGIRMRPLNDREINSGTDKIFKCQTSCNAVMQMNKDGQAVETYYYDKVFDEASSTADVYDHIGKDIVKGVMNGINGTIFAYGQTSSGKTHTMLGGGDQKGVLNMAAEDIFRHIAQHSNRDFLMRASFVELYQENIRDLLSDSSDATVAIREDPRKGVYCEAVEYVITDFDSVIRLLKKGIAKRAVEATAMNEASSRSHTIFKLVIESRESNRGGAETDGAVLVAALNLVDLAGSESVKHTGAMGQRAKEGGKINQSLLSLSRVITALSDGKGHINFRDSKLTRLLQPSLSGNAKMSIVCCITPADRYLEETRSTLQFASRAKLVVTHATVNEVLDEAAQIKRLKLELEAAKQKLRRESGSNAGSSIVATMDVEKEKELKNQIAQLESEKAALESKADLLRKYTTFSASTGSFIADLPIEEEGPKKKGSKKRSRQTIASSQLPMDDGAEAVPSREDLLNMQQDISSKTTFLSVMAEKENMNSTLRAAIEELQAKYLASQEQLAEQSSVIESLKMERDEANERLETEMGANAEYQEEQEQKFVSLKNQLLDSEATIESLQRELEDANQTMHLNREYELMEEKAALQSESEKMNEEIALLLQSLTSASSELSSTKVALAKAQHELASIETKMKNMMDESDAKDQTIVNLTEKLHMLEHDIAAKEESLQEAAALLAQKTQEQQETLEQHQKILAEKDEEIVGLQSKIAEMNEVAAQSSAQMTETFEAMKRSLSNAESSVLEMQSTLDQERQEKQNLLKTLEEANAAYMESQFRLAGKEEELIRSVDQINLLNDNNAVLNQQLECVNMQYQELQASDASQIESLTMQLQAQSEELAEAQNVMASSDEIFHSKMEELEQVTKEKNSMELSVAALQEEVNYLSKHLENDQSTSSEAAAKYTEEINAKEEEIVALKEEVVYLKSAFETSQQMLEQVKESSICEREKLLQEKSEVLQQIEEKDLLIQEKDILLQEKNLSLEEKENVLAEKDTLLQEKEMLIQEKDFVIQEKESLLLSKEQGLREEIDSMTVTIAEKEDEIAALKENEQLILSQHNDTIKGLEDELSCFRSQLEEKLIQCAALEEDLFSARKEIDMLKENVESWTEEARANEENANELIEKIQQLEESAKESTNSKATVQAALLAAQNDRDRLENEIATLKKSYDEVKTEYNVLWQENIRLSSASVQQELFNESMMNSDEETVEHKISTLEEENRTLQVSLQDITSCRDMVVQQCQALEQEKADLIANLSAGKEIHDEMVAEVESLKSQLKEELALSEEQIHLLEEEKSELNFVLNETTAAKEVLQQELVAAKGQIVNLEEKIQSLEDEKADLIVKECASKDIQDELQVKCEEQSNVIQQLESEKLTMLATVEHVSVLQQQVHSLQEQIAVHQQSISEIQASKDELIAKLTDAEHRAAFLESKVQSLTAENEQQRESLASMVSTAAASIGVNINRFDEIGLTKEAIDAARKDIQRSMESWQSELGNKEAELAKAWKENEDLTIRLRVAEEKLSSLVAETLQHTESDSFTKKRMQQLATENDLLKGEKDTMTLKLKELEASSKQKLDSSVKYSEKLENELSELQRKLEKSSQESQNSLALQESIKALERRCNEFKSERDEVKLALQERSQECKELQDSYDSIYEEVIKLRQVAENQDAMNAIATLEKEVERLNQVVQEMANEKQRLTDDLKELTQRFKKCKDDLAMMQQEMDRVVQEKTEIEATLNTAYERVDQLTTALEEAESMTQDTSAMAQLQTESEEAKQALTDAQVRIQSLEEQITESQQALQQAEEELLHFQSEYESAKTKLGELLVVEEEMQVIIEKLQEVEKEKDVLATNAACYEEEKSSLQQDLAQKQSTIEILENNLKSVRESLIEHEQDAKKEREFVMQMAEMQMETLRQEIDDLKKFQGEQEKKIEGFEENEKKMLIAMEKLQVALNDREDALAAVENELFELKNDASGLSNDQIQALEEESAKLKVSKQNLEQKLRKCLTELEENKEKITSMEEALQQKDERIKHLDACKLTKDQMEKIKVIKEERKKFQEDAKTLKKQLHQLKLAYDDMKTKSASSSSANAPSQEFVISDLKFQLAELSGKLTANQSIVDLLKDKLKECSTQLEEYEKERSAVVDILEKHGIDITGLIPLDTSSLASEDASASNVSAATEGMQDLSDAVSKLAQKMLSLQSMVSVRESTKSSLVSELEEKIRGLQADNEDMKAQKVALEKRMESLKMAARTSREEVATMTVELDALNTKVAQLQEELKNTERKVVNSSEVVSSEVQVLEEENIELIRENKELRIELSRLKSMAGTTVSVAPIASAPAQTQIYVEPSVSNENSATTPSVTASAMKKKRAFGTELDTNAAANPAVDTSVVKTASAMKRPLNVADQDAENLPAAAANKTTRRVRSRAAPAVSAAGEEKEGECKQS